ncbi:hypothetical protein RJ640_015930 [Escallonia rubra]|uniref:Reverse transcriptase Ty1/copia-type domain-containing protein n=1 Tax=Escallonia rubra TaxID=112253 RepID=A0AA88RY39_9ASTE|nr:hypothetical protein RJ640_015930 [Escallonia rubra]
MVTGNDPEEREALQGHLSKEFKMKDLGPLKFFLGIKMSRSNKGIFLSQRKYALDLLRETASCDIAHNPVQYDRTKHVEVKRFFIKEKLDEKIVELPHIRSEDQLVNIVTKAVSSIVMASDSIESSYLDVPNSLARYERLFKLDSEVLIGFKPDSKRSFRFATSVDVSAILLIHIGYHCELSVIDWKLHAAEDRIAMLADREALLYFGVALISLIPVMKSRRERLSMESQNRPALSLKKKVTWLADSVHALHPPAQVTVPNYSSDSSDEGDSSEITEINFMLQCTEQPVDLLQIGWAN